MCIIFPTLCFSARDIFSDVGFRFGCDEKQRVGKGRDVGFRFGCDEKQRVGRFLSSTYFDAIPGRSRAEYFDLVVLVMVDHLDVVWEGEGRVCF